MQAQVELNNSVFTNKERPSKCSAAPPQRPTKPYLGDGVLAGGSENLEVAIGSYENEARKTPRNLPRPPQDPQGPPRPPQDPRGLPQGPPKAGGIFLVVKAFALAGEWYVFAPPGEWYGFAPAPVDEFYAPAPCPGSGW